VASGCKNGQVRIFDLATSKCVVDIFAAVKSRVKTLEFSKDDEDLLVTGFDPEIKIFNA